MLKTKSANGVQVLFATREMNQYSVLRVCSKGLMRRISNEKKKKEKREKKTKSIELAGLRSVTFIGI